jgi:hypothetical protein
MSCAEVLLYVSVLKESIRMLDLDLNLNEEDNLDI